VDTSVALYKLLLITDEEGHYVFHPNGKYFVKQSAFPESMRESNLFKLQTGVAKDDHSWYALDGTKIVINWDPTTVPDIIYPVLDTSGPTLTVLSYEAFELAYRHRTSDEEVDSILFRAVFSKAPTAPKGISPELLDYNLRFS
jgi:hypothetical protein